MGAAPVFVARVRRDATRSSWRRLHEAGLQLDLEGGDGGRMIAERRFEMSQGEFRRLFRNDLWRFAHRAERQADRALGFEKSLPDSVRRGIAQSAVEIAEGLQFVARGRALLQKGPQALGGQEQAFDLLRPPDAEGPSAAGRPISIAAEDPPAANRFLALMFIVVAAEEPVADQVANALAMRARRRLQLRHDRFEFLLGLANSHEHDPVHLQTSLFRGSDCRKRRRAIVHEIKGGVRCLRQQRRACGVRRVCGLASRGGWPNCGCDKNIELRWQFGQNRARSASRVRPVTPRTSHRN